MDHSLMFFIFFLLFSSIVESVRPPKSYCTPHVSLIKYVTDSPDGKPFCSSLNSDPKTVTDVGIVTATETVTTTASETVTLVTRSGVTQTNFTTWTTTDLVTATATINTTVTNTATATAVSTVIKLTTTTVTTTAIKSGKPPNDKRSPETLTIHNPTAFPVALEDVIAFDLAALAPTDPWPPFLSGIPSSSVSSACDCIVGYPTSTITETSDSTVTATETLTETMTSISKSQLNITTTAVLWSNTSTTLTTSTITTATNRTLTTATTTTLFTTATSTVTVTTTAYPDCQTGYSSTGYAGTGNKVEVSPVEGDRPLACCAKCQNTPDCVASQLVGWLCQLLVNDVYIEGDVVTPSCQLGLENFPFSGNGPIFAGPCGY